MTFKIAYGIHLKDPQEIDIKAVEADTDLTTYYIDDVLMVSYKPLELEFKGDIGIFDALPNVINGIIRRLTNLGSNLGQVVDPSWYVFYLGEWPAEEASDDTVDQPEAAPEEPADPVKEKVAKK